MNKKFLFLTLRVFSATGGIEKVCRIAGKAINEITADNDGAINIFSMHDVPGDEDENRYFSKKIFRAFGGAKIKFVLSAITSGLRHDVIILSHINLLVIGWLIKKISPRKKIILFAHGIEVWENLTATQKKQFDCCSAVISVSRFTCKKLAGVHHLPLQKCKVLNNCLDPFLPLPSAEKNKNLQERFGISNNTKVIVSLTRISKKDRYKGYDKVIKAVSNLKTKYPGIKYILAGRYDADEKKYLDELIIALGLERNIILPGYIEDDELGNFYSLADVYTLPSKKEGFGISFIEAMYYGVPVIAGNADGSVDALDNGKLGLLINPDDENEIESAIEKVLDNKNKYQPDKALLLQKFSYESYKKNLYTLLQQVI